MISLLRGSPFPLPLQDPAQVQRRHTHSITAAREGCIPLAVLPGLSWAVIPAHGEWALIPAACLLCLLLSMDQVMGCSHDDCVLDNLLLLTPGPFQCMGSLTVHGSFHCGTRNYGSCCLKSTSLHLPFYFAVVYILRGSQGVSPLELFACIRNVSMSWIHTSWFF